jgi:DnaJ-class molecular chaperone
MSTLLIEQPPRSLEQHPMLTLEELVAGAWTQLGSRGHATCPACGGRMDSSLAPGRADVVGACKGCGSELS